MNQIVSSFFVIFDDFIKTYNGGQYNFRFLMPHYNILSVSFYSLYRLCTTEPWLKFCWDQKSTKSNVHKYIPNFVKVALAKSFLKDPDTYIKRLYSPKKTVVKNRNNIIHRNPSPKRYPPPNPHSHSESKYFLIYIK